MSLSDFFTGFEAAASKTKFTPEVQSLAQGINKETLQAAVEAALALDDKAELSNAEQAEALKKGFEFAVELVKMLTKLPDDNEKLDLYKYFKQSKNDPPKPAGMFDIAGKYKYKAWESISHVSVQKAQVEYIKQVDTLIKKYGTRDE